MLWNEVAIKRRWELPIGDPKTDKEAKVDDEEKTADHNLGKISRLEDEKRCNIKLNTEAG